jgi:hypothetical protein
LENSLLISLFAGKLGVETGLTATASATIRILCYPNYAKAAAERRAKLQRSADALRIELGRLKVEASEASNRQFAA